MDEELEQKIFKYLAIILSLASLLILVKVIFLPGPAPKSPEPIEAKRVKIDLKFLDNPALSQLTAFEEISLPKEVGRNNPFAPY